jgi:hypothetical protein
MSTRATYQFIDKDWRCRIESFWIYIHMDGYPSGAATYFNNMLHREDMPYHYEVPAERFFRANRSAEFTQAHHGDTAYHYEITGHKLEDLTIVCKHRNPSDEDAEWRIVYSGTLQDFLKANTELISQERYNSFDFEKYAEEASNE